MKNALKYVRRRIVNRASPAGDTDNAGTHVAVVNFARQAASRFSVQTSGSVAILFSMIAIVLAMAGGAAIDTGMLTSKKVDLQARADAAAIVGAKTLAIGGSGTTDVAEAAKAFALASGGQSATISVEVKTPDDRTVTVTVTEKWAPIFAHLFSSTISEIKASATSQIVGSDKICVLALDEAASGAVSLTGDAQLKANGCAVYSNSASSTGLSSYKGSVLAASLICSSGGIGGGASNFEPAPTLDCPKMSDPLAGRAPPSFGSCDYNAMSVNNETRTLLPGVYCGGLLITGSSNVKLEPGVYVMKDGPLEVTHTASVSGAYVGFYMTGDNSVFLFAGGSSVELAAPKDGPMAGLLFFEDPANDAGRYYEIVSENARKLVGTIYLPRGNFAVSSKKPVADLSDYTAIVANTIQLHKYPSLVLNTSYHTTDVPVPSGLTKAGAAISLIR